VCNADGLLNCSNSAGGVLGAAEADGSNHSALWRPFLPTLKDLQQTRILPRPSSDRVDAPERDEADRAAVRAAATTAPEGTTVPADGVRCEMFFVDAYTAISTLLGIGLHITGAGPRNAWMVKRDGEWVERELNDMLCTGHSLIGEACRCRGKVFQSEAELEAEATRKTQMLADIAMDEQSRAENLEHDNQVRPPYVPVAPRNVLVSPMHSKHDTFKPAFSVIWEDISVLFAKCAKTDVPLAQYDVLAALEERGTCILQPKRRLRGVELGQPVSCGNHIHIMWTTALWAGASMSGDGSSNVNLDLADGSSSATAFHLDLPV
jgi:hypothetical protein